MDSQLEKLIGCKSFAILGGTFDPVHVGHIEIAKSVIKKTGAEKILFLPSGNPPHKNSEAVTDSFHRLNMLKMAVEGEKDFVVSSIEIDREGKTYTIDTVKELRGIFGNSVKFFFIMGADALHYIYMWKNFEELLKICSFAAVTRPGYMTSELKKDVDILTDKYGGDIHIIDIPPVDVSSSKIRDNIENGLAINGMVDSRVMDYIEKYGLYRG
ncbi:nicotinate-nucleotide adenylyltransferase [Lachnospiraceae bacterium NSJ-143]|nr:nicotinate-nucleotide adenylyltransferase [Lachnospiraceae bacterium NSJ-143]